MDGSTFDVVTCMQVGTRVPDLATYLELSEILYVWVHGPATRRRIECPSHPGRHPWG